MGLTKATKYEDGVLTIADGEGVLSELDYLLSLSNFGN
jgi:hypothetical protein